MDRRQVLGGMAASIIARGGWAQGAVAPPQARVREGVLRGARADGVLVYRGVPFAAPPVGPLRFRPPRPAASWEGVRDATIFASAPIQPAAPGGVPSRAFLGTDTSEDCLYLNVWAPAVPGPHPVLVWIHGGGNIAGSASQAIDGSAFARRGIVVVSLAYRLGAFGFLELGRALGADYRESGTNGLRDLVAGLRWIRTNVAAFGGDPDRVTISGDSAGGKNVVALMASPAARGLFRAAIVESGSQTIHDLCSADGVARLFTDRLAADGQPAAALATMPAERLNAIQTDAMKVYDRPYPFRSIVGTEMLPQAPLEAFATPGTPVRLLIGTNRDESIIGVDRSSPLAALAQRDMANVPLAVGHEVEAGYATLLPTLDPLHRRVRLLTAEEYAMASFRIAEASRRTTPTWVYRFEQPAPSGPFAGWVPHGSEVMYAWNLFDQPLLAMAFGKADEQGRRLGEEMNARWAAFVHGGSPDAPGAVAWPPYDGDRALIFGSGGSSVGRVNRAEFDLWRGVALRPPACPAPTGEG